MAILVYEWSLYGLTDETVDREAIGILTGNAQKFNAGSIQGVNSYCASLCVHVTFTFCPLLVVMSNHIYI